jgi:C4-dicarboxylate transporter DctQ subunit
MMKFLRAPAPLIINVVKWVLCLLIGTMCICVFAQVLYRKILSGAIPWSEELARYLFVWSAWLGSAVALYRHSHFGVDMVVKIMPEFLRKATHVIVLIIGAAFFVIAIWKGFELSFNNWYQKSPAMRIPMTFAYLSVPVGSMLMLYFWITNSSKER